MNYEHYDKQTQFFRERPSLLRLILGMNHFSTLVGFLMYPALILLLILNKDGRTPIFILIPGLAFILVSLYRKKQNSPRPYETHPIHPLIQKEKSGESFPSRHCFSIFLIGGLWLGYVPAVGIIILFFGILLGAIRVIGGVHFLRDVLWGGIWGLASAAVTWGAAILLAAVFF